MLLKLTKGEVYIIEFRIRIWFSRQEFNEMRSTEFLNGDDPIIIVEIEDDLAKLISRKGIVYARAYSLSLAAIAE